MARQKSGDFILDDKFNVNANSTRCIPSCYTSTYKHNHAVYTQENSILIQRCRCDENWWLVLYLPTVL